MCLEPHCELADRMWGCLIPLSSSGGSSALRQREGLWPYVGPLSITHPCHAIYQLWSSFRFSHSHRYQVERDPPPPPPGGQDNPQHTQTQHRVVVKEIKGAICQQTDKAAGRGGSSSSVSVPIAPRPGWVPLLDVNILLKGGTDHRNVSTDKFNVVFSGHKSLYGGILVISASHAEAFGVD